MSKYKVIAHAHSRSARLANHSMSWLYERQAAGGAPAG